MRKTALFFTTILLMAGSFSAFAQAVARSPFKLTPEQEKQFAQHCGADLLCYFSENELMRALKISKLEADHYDLSQFSDSELAKLLGISQMQVDAGYLDLLRQSMEMAPNDPAREDAELLRQAVEYREKRRPVEQKALAELDLNIEMPAHWHMPSPKDKQRPEPLPFKAPGMPDPSRTLVWNWHNQYFVKVFRHCTLQVTGFDDCYPIVASTIRKESRLCHRNGEAIDLSGYICDNGRKRAHALDDRKVPGEVTAVTECFERAGFTVMYKDKPFRDLTTSHYNNIHISKRCWRNGHLAW